MVAARPVLLHLGDLRSNRGSDLVNIAQTRVDRTLWDVEAYAKEMGFDVGIWRENEMTLMNAPYTCNTGTKEFYS
jgi:hypothetical protein